MPNNSEFSPGQMEIAKCILMGMSSKQIAIHLNNTPGTVDKQRQLMCEKKGLSGNGTLKKYLIKERDLQMPIGNHPTVSLAGHWLSKFHFLSLDRKSSKESPKFRAGCQINLEVVKPPSSKSPSHIGESLCGRRRDGGVVYQHRFNFVIKGMMLAGIWDNENTEHVGCFQLHIHSDGQMMEGQHLGNTSNGVVKAGEWTWVRLEPDAKFDIRNLRLKEFTALDALIEGFLDSGKSIRIRELFEAT